VAYCNAPKLQPKYACRAGKEGGHEGQENAEARKAVAFLAVLGEFMASGPTMKKMR